MWKKKRRASPSGLILAIVGAGALVFFVRNMGADILRSIRMHRM